MSLALTTYCFQKTRSSIAISNTIVDLAVREEQSNRSTWIDRILVWQIFSISEYDNGNFFLLGAEGILHRSHEFMLDNQFTGRHGRLSTWVASSVDHRHLIFNWRSGSSCSAVPGFRTLLLNCLLGQRFGVLSLERGDCPSKSIICWADDKMASREGEDNDNHRI